MKLATCDNATRDGKLVVVSRDLGRAVDAAPFADTMQQAVENWALVQPPLADLSARLNDGRVEGFAFDPRAALAPLPRAWQWLDGSVYASHGDLVSRAFGITHPAVDFPLMYQGMSDQFIPPCADVELPSEQDGIDFEGEFAVIVDKVPMRTDAAAASQHIRLLVQVNDWSLRRLAPIEMGTGFGWILAKPACSMAPVAVTPDELGPAWVDGQIALPLNVWWNGARFGAARGDAMQYGFPQLIAHAARTRTLAAGTIIGSGTVSNENFREVGSSCIAERRGIEIVDEGAPRTAFMRFGDRVRMEVFDADGISVFGAIDQRVIEPLDV